MAYDARRKLRRNGCTVSYSAQNGRRTKAAKKHGQYDLCPNTPTVSNTVSCGDRGQGLDHLMTLCVF